MKFSNPRTAARIEYVAAMCIFGTIGIVVSSLPVSSGVCAFSRAFFGFIFIVAVSFFKKSAFDFAAVKSNILSLVLTGVVLGANWILLFASYEFINVPAATVCYYMNPVFLILLSPIFLGEKLSVRKLVCVAAAFCGMILVSGITNGVGAVSFIGIAFAIAAALCDTVLMLLSKCLTGVSGITRVTVQLATASVMLFVYVAATEGFSAFAVEPRYIAPLVGVGVLHTGIAYILFYEAICVLDAQSFAIFSYADPIVALAASALFLHEVLKPVAAVGALLILGVTFADGIADGIAAKRK